MATFISVQRLFSLHGNFLLRTPNPMPFKTHFFLLRSGNKSPSLPWWHCCKFAAQKWLSDPDTKEIARHPSHVNANCSSPPIDNEPSTYAPEVTWTTTDGRTGRLIGRSISPCSVVAVRWNIIIFLRDEQLPQPTSRHWWWISSRCRLRIQSKVQL